MADTTIKKYLSLERLEEYDDLIKTKIDSGDSSTLSSAKSYTNTEIAKITNGTVVVPEAEHSSTSDSATSASSADVATKANQLTTARTIALSGDASGSASFDGSADVSLTVTVADDSHNHVISNIDGLQTALDAKAATTYVDTALSGKASSTHNHDSAYDVKGSADTALASAKEYVDSKVSGLASTSSVNTAISTHNSATDAHSDIRATLAEVKEDVDAFFKDATISAAAKDTLKEIQDYITSDVEAAAAMTASLNNKADKNHTHEIANVTGLEDVIEEVSTAIDGLNEAIEEAKGAASAQDAVVLAEAQAYANIIADTKANASHTHTVSQISDLTATAAELNYMDGVTSNVQTQLDGKAESSHSHTITATATDDDVIVLTGTNGTNKVTYDAKHATSGVTAGTYKSVTVNAYGHVTGGSNPTTLSGYGITDAYTKTQVDSAVNAAKVTVDTALSATSTNPVQNKAVNSAISTLTSTVSANTQSISSHTTAIQNLQTAVSEITEITSAEIQSLFNA